MSAGKWTAGPWKIGPAKMRGFPVQYAETAYPIILADGSGAAICWIDPQGSRTQHKKLAALIVEAPAMAEVCELLRDWDRGDRETGLSEACSYARAILARIGGEK